jgi:hypothetical protein
MVTYLIGIILDLPILREEKKRGRGEGRVGDRKKKQS